MYSMSQAYIKATIAWKLKLCHNLQNFYGTQKEIFIEYLLHLFPVNGDRKVKFSLKFQSVLLTIILFRKVGM